MRIRFLDYDNLDDYELDAESDFRDGIADCTSNWNKTEEITISSPSPNGRFRIEGDNDNWNVGCQRLLVILNEDNEEIYKTPFDSIWTCDHSEEVARERLAQVREELLALQTNDWKSAPNEELEMNAYIKDCENEYMPDIF